ncbi:MAG: hypothetical protein R3B35_05890 [Gemmatimonadales bacterium]
MPVPEADPGRIRTIPFAARANRVDPGALATPPGADLGVGALLASLPDQLAAADLRRLIEHLAAAARTRRGVVLLLGGHVIKCGLAPLVIHLIRRGVVTHVALNGAAAIHDWELACLGGTSEDVGTGLEDGTFGMVAETGEGMNAAVQSGAREELGLGEALARSVRAWPGSTPGHSLLATCLDAGIGITVHPAIGADIIHQHPSFDGAATGATAARDFRRLAAALPTIDAGGAVLNIGSAVTLPEVFLKALTVARNLGDGRPRGFLAADLDMIRHYRPGVNVVDRPTRGHGIGIRLTGHHELLVPLLVWGVEDALRTAEPG